MLDRDIMIYALTSDGMFPATLTKSEAEGLSDDELYQLFLKLERREKGGDAFDKQKSTHGSLATFVWIGSGIYLFASSPDASVFSWQAAGFVFVGMFIAAVVFGWLGYGIDRGLSAVLLKVVSNEPTGLGATAISLLGLILALFEAALIFFVAQVVFRSFV